ncbi:MAG: HD family hydrolase [Pyrinomonadaceae bacterium]
MSTLIRTLIEIQRLKRLERTGWVLRGQPNGTESVAAHSFGVAVAAMMIVDEMEVEGVHVDQAKVMQMALLHDWAEARVGDLPRIATEYFGADVRREAEADAFADIVDGSTSAARYKELYREYEIRDSLEARIVKAADIVDLLVQVLALERAGAGGLDEFWMVAEALPVKFDGPAGQIVAAILESLTSARGEIN